MANLKSEETDTVWIGHEYLSHGTVRRIGNDVYFRNKPYLPFEGEILIGGNLEQIPKERRKVLRVGRQPKVSKSVEIIWADLKLNPYLYSIHPEKETELRTLRAENQMLKVEVSKLLKVLLAIKNQDLLSYEAKKLVESANDVKGFNRNSGMTGGNEYSPYNSFRGGGF